METRDKSCCCSANKSKTIYDFEVMAQGNKTVKLSDYKGKVMQIASCPDPSNTIVNCDGQQNTRAMNGKIYAKPPSDTNKELFERHGGRQNYGMADGHAESLSPEEAYWSDSYKPALNVKRWKFHN